MQSEHTRCQIIKSSFYTIRPQASDLFFTYFSVLFQ